MQTRDFGTFIHHQGLRSQRRWMMRRFWTVFLILGLLMLYGCDSARHENHSDSPAQSAAKEPPGSASVQMDNDSAATQAPPAGGGGGRLDSQAQDVSLDSGTTAPRSALATGRKSIRNAELTLETESPTDNQRRITAIAESLGGFVVTS